MTHTALMHRDKKVIWHPFTQHGIEADFLPVESAKGAWLHLKDGRKILDAISSWWVNLHGHGNPEIAQAIYKQALELEHTVFAGFTHEPAIEFAETLIAATQQAGAELTRCFYTDNGATAVEAAMKMAYQYHINLGHETRNKFIAIFDSYHGDTLGCMSLSERASYHSHFHKLLPQVDFISSEDVTALEKMLLQQPDQYAALIIEPMVQGATGMKMHSAEFLADVAALCKKAGVLLICDEVFTGFYRTGTCFAFEQAGIQPDILCLGKGITGGFLTLAATLTTEEIFNAYCSNDIKKAFLHGHTYTANPIACAAAIASWKILQQAATQQAIKNISLQTAAWIEHLSQHKNCEAARSLGTIGAIEKRHVGNYGSNAAYKIRDFALQHNILLRPLGAVVYTLPPYCTTEAELNQAYQVIEKILDKDF